MRLKGLTVAGALALLAAFTGCGKSNPAQPTVSMVAGAAVSPADGAQVLFASQPLTLSVVNGVTTGSAVPTYTFEVATDSGFANKVYSKDGVAQGAGSTTITIDKLGGSKTYFWRSRVVVGSSAGPYSAVRSFVIGPEVVIKPPAPISPAQNGTATGTATLIVANAERSGPAGAITYKFDVSGSSAFDSIVFTTTVAEGANGQTSVTVPAQTLVNLATYYWRAQAIDASNSITTAYSTAQQFQFVGFDMRTAHMWDAPSDLGSWPATATMTRVETSGPFVIGDFDKRDGPGRWPDEDFGSGSIEYTLGMCLNISAQWNCSTVVLFWNGRELEAGGDVNEIGINWFYDGRWGAMKGHQPQRGELVGIFVASGALRGRTASGSALCPRVCERSDVVLLPWGTNFRR